MVQITSMAFSRKDALRHIQDCYGPLATLIFQIYLFGDTQTLAHWKKELHAVLLVIRRNSFYTKGRKLTLADIVNALDQLALKPNIRLEYSELLGDPDYKKLRPRRDELPSPRQLSALLCRLAEDVLGEHALWSVADDLADEILSW